MTVQKAKLKRVFPLRAKLSSFESFIFHSPLGRLEICLQKGRLYSIKKLSKSATYKPPKGSSISKMAPVSSQMRALRKELEAYFKGEAVRFSLPLSDRGTLFQKKVWARLQKIPFGKTLTYGGIAAALKQPKAARAVGRACAKNPFLVVVPCHRVVSRSGLGGFALGLKAKKTLLKLENPYLFKKQPE